MLDLPRGRRGGRPASGRSSFPGSAARAQPPNGARAWSNSQTLLKLKAHLAALQGRDAGHPPQQEQQQEQQPGREGEDEEEEEGEACGPGPAAQGAEAAAGGAPKAAGGLGPARQRQVLPDAHPYAKNAIWQLPPLPLFFEGGRAEAKGLAKALAAEAAAAGAARR
jgi:hypothetical protein